VPLKNKNSFTFTELLKVTSFTILSDKFHSPK
jgi:hypothetical protein